VKNGEKTACRDDGAHLATLTIGEISAEIRLLPVLHGEKMPIYRLDRQADERRYKLLA